MRLIPRHLRRPSSNPTFTMLGCDAEKIDHSGFVLTVNITTMPQSGLPRLTIKQAMQLLPRRTESADESAIWPFARQTCYSSASTGCVWLRVEVHRIGAAHFAFSLLACPRSSNLRINSYHDMNPLRKCRTRDYTRHYSVLPQIEISDETRRLHYGEPAVPSRDTGAGFWAGQGRHMYGVKRWCNVEPSRVVELPLRDALQPSCRT